MIEKLCWRVPSSAGFAIKLGAHKIVHCGSKEASCSSVGRINILSANKLAQGVSVITRILKR